MHIQRHSQLLRHRRERTTPRARRTPSVPLSRDRENGDGTEIERRLFGYSGGQEKDGERQRKTRKKRKREGKGDSDGKESVGVLTISFIFYVGFCRRSKITRQRRRLPTIPDDDRARTRLYQLPREFRGTILQVNHTAPDNFRHRRRRRRSSL